MLDGRVMGLREREWAFDEMSVKDGMIVRIDQAPSRPAPTLNPSH